MYNSQDIAERIKNAAAQNNCKLGDMFAELGISANTLHNMKTSMPKTDTLAKIADYLNVSVDYLLGRQTKNSTPDDIRSAIISIDITRHFVQVYKVHLIGDKNTTTVLTYHLIGDII